MLRVYRASIVNGEPQPTSIRRCAGWPRTSTTTSPGSPPTARWSSVSMINAAMIKVWRGSSRIPGSRQRHLCYGELVFGRANAWALAARAGAGGARYPEIRVNGGERMSNGGGRTAAIRAARRRAATKALSMPRTQSAIVRLGSLLPFEQWEQRGWHLTPNHFYSAIPDTREVGPALREKSDLPGIDMRDAAQESLLKELSAEIGDELAALPRSPPVSGVLRRQPGVRVRRRRDALRADPPLQAAAVLRDRLGLVDAVRADRARRNVAEGHPVRARGDRALPVRFPAEDGGRPAAELSVEKVQDVPMDRFTSLGDGDILFIDSSHVCGPAATCSASSWRSCRGSRRASWCMCTTSSCRRSTRGTGFWRSTGSGTSSTCCRRS